MTASADAKTLEAMREGTDQEWAKAHQEMEAEVPGPAPEPVEPEALDQEPISAAELFAKFGEWLHISDPDSMRITIAARISEYLEGERFWLQVVGPSGSGKSEFLQTFTGDGVVTISSLTSHSLISGLRKGDKLDLLPKLDGKVLILKDFTTTLTMHREARDELFSQLREAYDGAFCKAFGSSAGMKSYKSRFTIIAGVTPVIETYRRFYAVLGERFLRVRLKVDPAQTLVYAANLQGHEKIMRQDLRQAMGRFVHGCREALKNPPPIDHQMLPKLMALAQLTATIRTPIIRDRERIILVKPEPEIGTRLTKQFSRVMPCLAVVLEHDQAGEPEYSLVKRVAADTMPTWKLGIIEFLAADKSNDFPTHEIGQALTMPTRTARDRCEDLWELGLVERFGDSAGYVWRISPLASRLLDAAEWITEEEEEF